MIRYNFELLQRPEIRRQISDLLIECLVRNHLIISIRALYNFIYDLVVPVELASLSCKEEIKRVKGFSEKDFLRSIIPNYIFEHPELSPVFAQLRDFDPAAKRREQLDSCVIELMVSADHETIFNKYIPLEKVGNAFQQALKELKDQNGSSLVNTFIRSVFFWEDRDQFGLHDDLYHEYMRLLYGWYSGNSRSLRPAYQLVQHAITNWLGTSPDGHINLEVGKQQLDYRISEVVEATPAPLDPPLQPEGEVEKFQLFLPLRFKVDGTTSTLNIHYRLFELTRRMKNGYCPTRKDHSDFVHFSNFIESVSTVGNAKSSIHFTESNGQQYVLELDTFGDFCFKEVKA